MNAIDVKITPHDARWFGAGLFDYPFVNFIVETAIFFLGIWVYLTFTSPSSKGGLRANPNLLTIISVIMVVQQAHFCFGA